MVRDATKVGSTIVAVGGSATHNQVLCLDASGTTPPGCNVFAYGPDTAVKWEWDGINAPVGTALPNLVVNTGAVSAVFASAITPDGAYIASRARSHTLNGQRQAVRVTSALVPFPSANLNLAAFTPTLNPNTAAVAVSADGSILYGFSPNGSAYRFDTASQTTAVIPPPAGAASIVPAGRGVSADGSVMVGSTNSLGAGRAYRYVYGGGLSAIPLLPGGTWNNADAVTPDGATVFVVGNSNAYPNGEAYLFNAQTQAVVRLGSANSSWTPNNFGGITADGSVVAASSFGPTRSFAYFHNSHGWFLLTSALGAQGIDLKAQGWTSLGVMGLSPDGTLAFGQGIRNDIVEGWVAEFPAGYLAAFDAPAVPVADTRIVGTWTDDPANPNMVLALMADGTYYEIEPSGFERGVYTWDGATGRFTVTTRQDTNGDDGLSDNNGERGLTVSVSGDVLTGTDAACPTCIFTATRITGSPGSIVGGWVFGTPATADSSGIFVMTPAGKYFFAKDGDNSTGAQDGIEIGMAVWDPATHVITPQLPLLVDTNGDEGLSNPIGAIVATLTADELGLDAGDASGTQLLLRIIDPLTVTPAITSPLTASGTATVPFSYNITASHTLTYAATGAGWLTAAPATGLLSGTPPAAGTYTVSLSATNTLGLSAHADLVIAIAAPNTATGSDVAVAPTVPAGSAPVSLTFSSVAAPGETTVTAVDPATAPAPPAGFQLGPVYYDVATTASYSGPVTLCFSYAGLASSTTPRLFHFESGAWTDITTSVNAQTQTICGTASSFSPFAVFSSPVTRTGFYAPVNSTPGFVNVIEDGAAVPLKFNVYVNGVAKTDTAGLVFSAVQVSCPSIAPGRRQSSGDAHESDSGRHDADDRGKAPVSPALRFDATSHQYVQVWRVPKIEGVCFEARMTTSADGLWISALFRTK